MSRDVASDRDANLDKELKLKKYEFLLNLSFNEDRLIIDA